jgi:transcriptional regulator with XRE-family HTH domain
LTLIEAAEKLGIGRDTLSDLERGNRHPVMPTLAKIAKGYGVPVEDLLEEPALAGAPGKDEAPQAGHATYEEEQAALRSMRREGKVNHWRDLLIQIGALLQDIRGTYEVTPDTFGAMTTLAFTTLRLYELENPKAGATPEQIDYLEQAEGVLQSGLLMLEERAEKAQAGITSLTEYKEKKARAFGPLRSGATPA